MTLTSIMDTCVPSPNSINTTYSLSPHSIYESERSRTLFSCDLKMDKNSTIEMCSSYEENHTLDDHFEDSSLQITPEMLNSMAIVTDSHRGCVSNTSSSAFNKLDLVDSQIPTMAYQPLALEMVDSEYLSDLLNNDSNDSKFSLPNFDLDLFPSNVPSTCQTPTPSSEIKPDYQENKYYVKDVIFSSPSMPQECIEQDFRQKKQVLKHQQFPPRKSEPPVGVVVPVKIKEEVESYPMIQTHLFQINAIKVKKDDKMGNDLPPQIVPSFTQSEQVGCDSVTVDQMDSGKKRQFISSFQDDNVKEMKPTDFHPISQTKRRRYDSGSSLLTSEDGDEYIEGFQPEYESDDDNSDLDADLAHLKPGNCESLIEHGKKQKQYFWQYNVQAKGPKGTRLKLCVESPTDPHVLNGFEDPVFDEGNTIVAGIRHGGKARKGDGNEVTPNPYKLFKIGQQLLRLNKKINACQLGSDVPIQQRNEARREKNKLASRACRLKKKAQHEANKIKLHGLEIEHGQINSILRNMWPELREKAKQLQAGVNMKCDPNCSLTDKITNLIKSNMKDQVACQTTEFVNQVIMNVEKNDLSGGLDIKVRKT